MPTRSPTCPVDLAEGLDRACNDRAFYKELIEMLVEQVPREVGEMRRALQRGDLETVGRLAHALKGAAANLAAGPARELALEIETLARSACSDRIDDLLARLQQEGERLSAFAATL